MAKAKYRLLESVTYVADGAVVSADKGREVELTKEQATDLAAYVVLVDSSVDSMFPDGTPIIDPTIVRTVPATPVAGETVVGHPEPEVEAPKAPEAKPAKALAAPDKASN